MIIKDNRSITVYSEKETIRIEAWGSGIRVRAVPMGDIPEIERGLLPSDTKEIVVTDDYIENAGLRCEIKDGLLRFIRVSDGKVLLEESSYPWALHRNARTYKTISGTNNFETHIYFRAHDEILHGMGQYRDALYDLKGCKVELAPRNSQISVPFLLSSAGYGFLWNDPAVGYASFAKNETEWYAASTRCVDYWVTTGDTPAAVIGNYADVTGHASPLPESLYGLWQCKLRYRTQDELLEAAREYKKRGITPDVMVIDFFHWIYQGDWDFDPEYWYDPKSMVDELHSMGIRVMVSVWPTVDPRSRNYKELNDNGFLIRTERGLNAEMEFYGKMCFIDSTNPAARKYVYGLLKKNYGKYGIDMFWLDEAEPEYSVYDHEHYHQYIGSVLETANMYPRCHAQMLYDGQKDDNIPDILNLIRCAWVGSQQYGVLVWSGDIESTFREMKVQLRNGLNMGIAGIPWWISDTGGFYNGDINDPEFKELLVRWFQWAVYMPILRMHGDRLPNLGSLVTDTDHGGGFCPTGSPNELWSFGEDVYEILLKYLRIRESMKQYIKETSEETVRTGLPMMRAMFIEFPDEKECYDLDDQYMFGSRYLVAPVTVYKSRERRVYLPAGKWVIISTGETILSAGKYITVSAPLDIIPVFERE